MAPVEASWAIVRSTRKLCACVRTVPISSDCRGWMSCAGRLADSLFCSYIFFSFRKLQINWFNDVYAFVKPSHSFPYIMNFKRVEKNQLKLFCGIHPPYLTKLSSPRKPFNTFFSSAETDASTTNGSCFV